MSFIQGNINSNEDLIEAIDAMRNMLTQGDYKAELKLELAEVNHKLADFNSSELGGATYARYGILHALKENLEDTLQKLEEAEKEPQETGYDDPYEDEDFYDEDDDEEGATDYIGSLAFLEERLRKLEEVEKGPQEDEHEDYISSEEFLEEILEKINAKTQAKIDKLRKSNIGW